jgi:hypothetical protein
MTGLLSGAADALASITWDGLMLLRSSSPNNAAAASAALLSNRSTFVRLAVLFFSFSSALRLRMLSGAVSVIRPRWVSAVARKGASAVPLGAPALAITPTPRALLSFQSKALIGALSEEEDELANIGFP